MPVICEQLRLAYFPVPKVACTSLKSFFFRINNRAEFARLKIGDRHLTIHHIPGYAEEAFRPEFRERFSGYERIAVVRDPLDRLTSAFRNKIAKARLLERDADAVRECRRQGLASDPDLGAFLANVEDYARVSTEIRHHTVGQGHFLGDDLGFYDRIFRLEDAADLEDMISARLGRPEKLPHHNSTGAMAGRSAIPADALAAAIRFCEGDYELLAAYYPRPAP